MEIYILSALFILIILFVIVLVMCIKNSRALSELNEYAEDGDLGLMLAKYYKKINELRVMIHDSSDKVLESRIEECEKRIKSNISKMSIVSFDAFDDVTGKLSFSLALLDMENNGFILTSLYGHSSCNTYIRNVSDGVSSVKLIEEEKSALEKAINGERKISNNEN